MGVIGAGSVVFGATGLVGRAVAALLAERGGPVVALTRRPVGLARVSERVADFSRPAAAALPFEAVHIARPSLLLGARSESRPAEAFVQALAPWLGWLLPAHLRPIRAEAVARALLRLADEGQPGVHIHESDELARLGA